MKAKYLLLALSINALAYGETNMQLGIAGDSASRTVTPSVGISSPSGGVSVAPTIGSGGKVHSVSGSAAVSTPGGGQLHIQGTLNHRGTPQQFGASFTIPLGK